MVLKEKVCVLLSTYNGEKYLKSQIESILSQRNVEVTICVRDDGSTDNTSEILDQYKSIGKLTWYAGKNVGPAYSFLDLLGTQNKYDYYAFSDQDDVWLMDKLEIAIGKLKEYKSYPAMYYGAARVADEELNWNGKHTRQYVIRTFKQAVVQSNAVGCTCVMNSALRDIVVEKSPRYVYMHDSWVHKVCSIVGGKMFFDEDVHVLYRQHERNVVGFDTSIRKRIRDYVRKIREHSCVRSKQIKSLLECYADKMSPEEIALAKTIVNYQNNFKCKLKLLFGGVRTGYWSLDLKFRVAVLLEIY